MPRQSDPDGGIRSGLCAGGGDGDARPFRLHADAEAETRSRQGTRSPAGRKRPARLRGVNGIRIVFSQGKRIYCAFPIM